MSSKHKYVFPVDGAQIELRINCYNHRTFSPVDANKLAVLVFEFCAAIDYTAQKTLQEKQKENDDLTYWTDNIEKGEQE